VNEEIRQFASMKGADNIIPLLISGIPNNEAKGEQAAEMAFPDALCEVMEMPLATSCDFSHSVGSWANGMKLASALWLDSLLAQFLPGCDHQREALGSPLLDPRLYPMGAFRVDPQRHA
jgi:hypothetical protein